MDHDLCWVVGVSTFSRRAIISSSSSPVLLESTWMTSLVRPLEEILRLDQVDSSLAWVMSWATTSMNGLTSPSFSRA